jgi:hypothetical protein
MHKPPETVGEGQAVLLDDLAEVLARARLRPVGEIEWRTVAGRERACVAMEPNPAPAPEEPWAG